ncbi:MAG: hypothetical protein IKW00_09780 [Clostridia bacterium]|nr:hypothetical protein [Clostridia bacterium]
MIVLGIDTSCYTTSVAAACDQGILCSNRRLLPVAAGARGLRQSEAVFAHIRQLPELFEKTMETVRAQGKVDAVCVSSKPRDDEASYMPVFLSGLSFARVTASALNVPLFETTHQRGHVRAAYEGSGMQEDTYLAVHLSGGTTEVLLMDGDKLSLHSGTMDLHAGQFLDRVGVKMGLHFPAGPYMEALAKEGKAQSRIPVSIQEGKCHFSGAEARAMQWIEKGEMPKEEIAAEVFSVIERTVLRMLVQAAEKTGVDRVLLTGGVASSQLLRDQLLEINRKRRMGLKLYFGQREYAGDNAAGVALIGRDLLKGE